MSFVTHVECTVCGHHHDAKRVLTVCEQCGQMLAVRYDVERVKAAVTKEALRVIAAAAPEPIAQSEVVKALTGAGYKATDSLRQSLIDGLDSLGQITGDGIIKTARDARKSVVYEMNSQMARQLLKALRPR